MFERILTPRVACLLLALASALILLAALALQVLGGLAPCHLCVLQRWPYVALIGLGLIGWRWQPRPLLALSALVLLGGAGLAGYHIGVEQGWVALPESCVAGGSAQTVEQLKQMLAEAPPSLRSGPFFPVRPDARRLESPRFPRARRLRRRRGAWPRTQHRVDGSIRINR